MVLVLSCSGENVEDGAAVMEILGTGVSGGLSKILRFVMGFNDCLHLKKRLLPINTLSVIQFLFKVTWLYMYLHDIYLFPTFFSC